MRHVAARARAESPHSTPRTCKNKNPESIPLALDGHAIRCIHGTRRSVCRYRYWIVYGRTHKAGRVRHGPRVPLFTPRAAGYFTPPNFPLVAGPSPHPLRRSRRRKGACWTAHATHTEGESQRESGGLAQTVAGSGGGGDVRGARGGASRRGAPVARGVWRVSPGPFHRSCVPSPTRLERRPRWYA